jgi:alkylated DNA repair dioxygenase AlkB
MTREPWHSDKESRYGSRPVIASISLGQTRNFDFRKKDNHSSKYSLPLPHGSLFIYGGCSSIKLGTPECQTNNIH